jgi:hypothetical protein
MRVNYNDGHWLDGAVSDSELWERQGRRRLLYGASGFTFSSQVYLASTFSVLMSLPQIKLIILYSYYSILIEYTLINEGGVVSSILAPHVLKLPDQEIKQDDHRKGANIPKTKVGHSLRYRYSKYSV